MYIESCCTATCCFNRHFIVRTSTGAEGGHSAYSAPLATMNVNQYPKQVPRGLFLPEICQYAKLNGTLTSVSPGL